MTAHGVPAVSYSNGSSMKAPSYQAASTRTCVPEGSEASATWTSLAANASATWRTSERRNSSPTAPAVPAATAASRSWPRSLPGAVLGGMRRSYRRTPPGQAQLVVMPSTAEAAVHGAEQPEHGADDDQDDPDRVEDADAQHEAEYQQHKAKADPRHLPPVVLVCPPDHAPGGGIPIRRSAERPNPRA